MKYDILLIGGNGFVGRRLAAKLQLNGFRVLLPTRNISASNELRLLPNTNLVDANVSEFDVLKKLCSQVKPNGVVINLVGVLHDKPAVPYGKVFRDAHVTLVKNIISCMQIYGLKRYLHMSALGADSSGPSMYQRSKGDAENAIRESHLDWTIFRPSVIFGRDDEFINLFIKLCKIFPILPLANSTAKFQPVNVDDVASAFLQALSKSKTIHHAYDLVGPQVLTMKEIVNFSARKARTYCLVISIPQFLGYLQATMYELLPFRTLMSRDNIASMAIPNVLPKNSRDALVEDFGIARHSLEDLFF